MGKPLSLIPCKNRAKNPQIAILFSYSVPYLSFAPPVNYFLVFLHFCSVESSTLIFSKKKKPIAAGTEYTPESSFPSPSPLLLRCLPHIPSGKGGVFLPSFFRDSSVAQDPPRFLTILRYLLLGPNSEYQANTLMLCNYYDRNGPECTYLEMDVELHSLGVHSLYQRTLSRESAFVFQVNLLF